MRNEHNIERDTSTARDGRAPAIFPENIYGHLQRLHWIRHRIDRGERVLELGCGTGALVTIPLLSLGYNIMGIDLDTASIEYGRRRLERLNLDPAALSTHDLRVLPGAFDAIIMSEVLEHLMTEDLSAILTTVRKKLRDGGRLLVTVPNGYGWFELESLLWYQVGVQRAYERWVRGSKLSRLVKRAKLGITNKSEEYDTIEPMTLAPSPHLQRFTWRSIRLVLEDAGFVVRERRGAVLICGPVSDLLFSGFDWIIAANARLGKWLSPIASDFYIVAEKRDEAHNRE